MRNLIFLRHRAELRRSIYGLSFTFFSHLALAQAQPQTPPVILDQLAEELATLYRPYVKELKHDINLYHSISEPSPSSSDRMIIETVLKNSSKVQALLTQQLNEFDAAPNTANFQQGWGTLAGAGLYLATDPASALTLEWYKDRSRNHGNTSNRPPVAFIFSRFLFPKGTAYFETDTPTLKDLSPPTLRPADRLYFKMLRLSSCGSFMQISTLLEAAARNSDCFYLRNRLFEKLGVRLFHIPFSAGTLNGLRPTQAGAFVATPDAIEWKSWRVLSTLSNVHSSYVWDSVTPTDLESYILKKLFEMEIKNPTSSVAQKIEYILSASDFSTLFSFSDTESLPMSELQLRSWVLQNLFF